MKTTEMRELTPDEIQSQIEQARKELIEARFKRSVNQLENTAVLGQLKNRVARLNTILRQKTVTK